MAHINEFGNVEVDFRPLWESEDAFRHAEENGDEEGMQEYAREIVEGAARCYLDLVDFEDKRRAEFYFPGEAEISPKEDKALRQAEAYKKSLMARMVKFGGLLISFGAAPEWSY